ncbi:helix-turn-helix transcriptional regulator [Spirillospora sp. NPDC048911]|uniref:helix-turn-helix transcriptional regulator n=1 Tax=Spirillospora sp. NPDC048911 TaxID=3364527 RepID=UPI00371D8CC2
MGDIKVSPKAAQQSEEVGVTAAVSSQVDRTGDRLLQLDQMAEITTLSEATLRWLRHRGEGPPMFKLGRRLVCWERDLHAWIAAEAAKDQTHSA